MHAGKHTHTNESQDTLPRNATPIQKEGCSLVLKQRRLEGRRRSLERGLQVVVAVSMTPDRWMTHFLANIPSPPSLLPPPGQLLVLSTYWKAALSLYCALHRQCLRRKICCAHAKRTELKASNSTLGSPSNDPICNQLAKQVLHKHQPTTSLLIIAFASLIRNAHCTADIVYHYSYITITFNLSCCNV